MKNSGKREPAIEKEVEQFCQGAAKVLTKIHDRINEQQPKKQQKKKKPTVYIEYE